MEQLNEAVQESASRGAGAGVAAVVVWGLVHLLKSDLVPIEVPARVRPFVALGLGQAYAVLEMIVGGMEPGAAVVRGLVVAAGAIAAHEAASKAAAK